MTDHRTDDTPGPVPAGETPPPAGLAEAPPVHEPVPEAEPGPSPEDGPAVNAVEDGRAEDAVPQPPFVSAAAPAPLPPAVPAAPPSRRTPVAALVVTGLAAAAVGGAVAFWLDLRRPADDALADRLAAQEAAAAALSARIDGLPAAPDLAPLQQDIAALRADLVAATEGWRPALDGLTARLDALERAPSADGTLPDRALAAWAADLDALRADLAAQADRIDAVAAQSAARLDATAEELAGIEAQATEAAMAAARRGAALRVLAALDSGQPFADPLAEALGPAAPPPTLAALAPTGAPTLAALADAFPEAARAALATARAEGLTGEEEGTFLSFLRSQFDVRSTVPQSGDSPDAILSRAEAALRAAELDAALAEIAALPEVVRGAMGDWLTEGQTRQRALAEAAALAETLNVN